MPYKYALNDLTQAELLAYSNKSVKQEKQCAYCDEKFMARKGQRFCCPQHRTAMGRLVQEEEFNRMRRRVSLLEKENSDLIKEISQLNKELAGFRNGQSPCPAE